MSMDYQGTIIRPPSEGDSILLQVTLGCSHSKCGFCGAYLDKRFDIKDQATVSRDIDFAAAYCGRQRRVFLCDGDAMILPMKRLRFILEEIREKLPWVTRVGTYANAKSLKSKSLEDLKALRSLGLGIVYMGLESGDDELLRRMGKYGDSRLMIDQGRRVRQAGMKLNVTVINGLGGPEGSRRHAEETARAINAMEPDQVAALSLMLVPGTPLHAASEAGEFRMLNAAEMLTEIRGMLAGMELPKGLFLANHASNYLPLKVRLPSGKQAALDQLDQALAGALFLKPESLRRL